MAVMDTLKSVLTHRKHISMVKNFLKYIISGWMLLWFTFQITVSECKTWGVTQPSRFHGPGRAYTACVTIRKPASQARAWWLRADGRAEHCRCSPAFIWASRPVSRLQDPTVISVLVNN